jgi:hypothetical protein
VGPVLKSGMSALRYPEMSADESEKDKTNEAFPGISLFVAARINKR